MKRIRILSDLHLDVNSGYCFKLKDNNDFTVIAGDTSGDPKMTSKWISKNIKAGVFVSGNHLVYNNRNLDIQALRNELHENFPETNDVTYLDNECDVISKEVDGILFIGTCLYTDMKLPSTYKNPNGIVDINCNISERYMNDFRWGKVLAKDEIEEELDGKRCMRAKDYIKWFNSAIDKIETILTENENLENPKPVVIVTHHAPSRKCIGNMYVDNDANCAYVSDLDDFIKKHSSIKCWVYGHIHEHKEDKIIRDDGTFCTLVNNSRGYCGRCEDMKFNPGTFLNTETWEIEQDKLSKSAQAKLKKREKEYSDKLAQMLAWGFF